MFNLDYIINKLHLSNDQSSLSYITSLMAPHFQLSLFNLTLFLSCLILVLPMIWTSYDNSKKIFNAALRSALYVLLISIITLSNNILYGISAMEMLLVFRGVKNAKLRWNYTLMSRLSSFLLVSIVTFFVVINKTVKYEALLNSDCFGLWPLWLMALLILTFHTSATDSLKEILSGRKDNKGMRLDWHLFNVVLLMKLHEIFIEVKPIALTFIVVYTVCLGFSVKNLFVNNRLRPLITANYRIFTSIVLLCLALGAISLSLSLMLLMSLLLLATVRLSRFELSEESGATSKPVNRFLLALVSIAFMSFIGFPMSSSFSYFTDLFWLLWLRGNYFLFSFMIIVVLLVMMKIVDVLKELFKQEDRLQSIKMIDLVFSSFAIVLSYIFSFTNISPSFTENFSNIFEIYLTGSNSPALQQHQSGELLIISLFSSSLLIIFFLRLYSVIPNLDEKPLWVEINKAISTKYKTLRSYFSGFLKFFLNYIFRRFPLVFEKWTTCSSRKTSELFNICKRCIETIPHLYIASLFVSILLLINVIIGSLK